MKPVEFQWARHPARRWYRLAFMDLENRNITVPGVYVIWPFGKTGYLYVGQASNIGEALLQLAGPSRSRFGQDACITWARVEGEGTRLGIERYLAEKLRPTVNAPRTDRPPVPCTHPYLS